MSAQLLSVRNLRVEVRAAKSRTVVVSDASFDLRRGEIVALVGESGAGKSTVGNAVMGLLERPLEQTGGRVVFEGQDIASTTAHERAALRGRRMGMIFQDPQTALDPLMRIGHQIVETIRLRAGLAARAAHARALAVLEEVGIPDAIDRFDAYPHEFSGGMRQRIVIALALCADPALIVADEPTTALDVTLQKQVLGLIRGLCKDRGLGVLLVTHNMGVVSEVADHVAVMRDGHIVEAGSPEVVLGRPQHSYTRALVAAVPRMEPCDPLRRTSSGTPSHQIQGHAEATPVLRVRDVAVTFPGRQRRRSGVVAVAGVSFDVMAGQALGIVGESGSGKSTLARAICGLHPLAGGEVRITPHLAEGRARGGGLSRQMIFQDPFSSLNPRMRVGDIVGEALQYFGLVPRRAARAARVASVLVQVGLPADAASRFPHQFSGGQRQRVSIARALAVRPELLICDEPTSALDVSVQAQVLAMLEQLRHELGLTMLFISHDLAVVRQVCDSVAVMRKGEIVEIGETERVFERPHHAYTRELIDAMPSTAGLAAKADPSAAAASVIV